MGDDLVRNSFAPQAPWIVLGSYAPEALIDSAYQRLIAATEEVLDLEGFGFDAGDAGVQAYAIAQSTGRPETAGQIQQRKTDNAVFFLEYWYGQLCCVEQIPH